MPAGLQRAFNNGKIMSEPIKHKFQMRSLQYRLVITVIHNISGLRIAVYTLNTARMACTGW